MRRRLREGFTLLELIVSTGIFSFLVISAIGVTLGLSRAYLKVAGLQAIQDNIRFSMELITKEMRTGKEYELSASCAPSGAEIRFTTAFGERRVYFLDSASSAIMRARESITPADCTNPAKVTPFTSDEVRVEHLVFRLVGALAGPNDGQPTVTIAIQVRSRAPQYQLESSMNLQTTVVQRLRDL